MKTIIKKSFSNKKLSLDNKAYIECTFESCLLTYSGKGSFQFSANQVSPDSSIEFRGHAANTIAALQDLYDLGDWGQSRVLSALHQITGKTETRPLNKSTDDNGDDSLGHLVRDD